MRGAGLDPDVMVSNVDEGGVEGLAAMDAVLVLARRKAEAVVAKVAAPAGSTGGPLVVGCDSLLEFKGHVWGKAASPGEVIERWMQMRGHDGLLHTGHCLVDVDNGALASTTDTAVVRFGMPTEREVSIYAATEEALQVAGPFTLEGRSAPWIESIEGNYGTITGISLPVLRRLMLDLGVDMADMLTGGDRA
jgi:septum formation protein